MQNTNIAGSFKKILLSAFLLSLLVACAEMVPMSPTDYYPCENPSSRQIELTETVTFMLSTQYSRTLRKGSTWQEVGKLPQGLVYRPVKSVFTLEGRQVHEAYLVISGKKLVGFYLPVESSFSPIVEPIILPLGDAL